MALEPGTRARRVGEGVREELSSLIASRVKDPRVSGTVVTRVTMGNDLRSAAVYVRLLVDGDDPNRRREVVGALRKASGMLRREVAQRLCLRFAPELRFAYDEGLDQTTNVERLLAEIEAERRSR